MISHYKSGRILKYLNNNSADMVILFRHGNCKNFESDEIKYFYDIDDYYRYRYEKIYRLSRHTDDFVGVNRYCDIKEHNLKIAEIFISNAPVKDVEQGKDILCYNTLDRQIRMLKKYCDDFNIKKIIINKNEGLNYFNGSKKVISSTFKKYFDNDSSINLILCG